MNRICFAAILAILAVGCAPRKMEDDNRPSLGPGGGDSGFNLDVGGGSELDVGKGPGGPCVGLECQQEECDDGRETTVTGTVYAPNGTLPLYNVQVYVPNAPVAPLPKGAACDKCGTVVSGNPLVTALTDAHGKFELKNVPVGDNIPLVIQLGKWRRETTIPNVTACIQNKITDKNRTRLPRNQKEGNMPRIAVTVGGCDKLSCMLPKIGIDASEFGVWSSGDSKAVHFYQPKGDIFAPGGPAGMADARDLWSNKDRLMHYDLAIFSCECSEAPATKDSASFKAVADYLAAGGRIFTTDFQYNWYKQSPDAGLKSAIPSIPGDAPTGGNPVQLDTSFPKGKALSDWLVFVDSSASAGKVQCDYVFNNFSPADKAKSQVWGSSSGGEGGAGAGKNPRFVTINTPVGKPAESQCGKAVHLDAHINSSDTIDSKFPAGCTTPIKQGEEAFAFFFFDLASCIQKESEAPTPPPIK